MKPNDCVKQQKKEYQEIIQLVAGEDERTMLTQYKQKKSYTTAL